MKLQKQIELLYKGVDRLKTELTRKDKQKALDAIEILKFEVGKIEKTVKNKDSSEFGVTPNIVRNNSELEIGAIANTDAIELANALKATENRLQKLRGYTIHKLRIYKRYISAIKDALLHDATDDALRYLDNALLEITCYIKGLKEE